MTDQPPTGRGWGPAQPSEPDQNPSTVPPPESPTGSGQSGRGSVPPPRGRGGAAKTLVGVGGAVIVVAIAVAIVAAVRGGTSDGAPTEPEAKAGDCIAGLPTSVQEGKERFVTWLGEIPPMMTSSPGADAGDAKVVACGTPEAKFTVLGQVDGVSRERAYTPNSDVCQSYLTDGLKVRYHVIPVGGTGYVLCLKPV